MSFTKLEILCSSSLLASSLTTLSPGILFQPVRLLELFKLTFLILPPDFINTVFCLEHFSMLFWPPWIQTWGYGWYLTSSEMPSIKSLLQPILHVILQCLDPLFDKYLHDGTNSLYSVHHNYHSCELRLENTGHLIRENFLCLSLIWELQQM